MKNFKKLSALLIALFMILSLILPVLAADYPTEEIDETVVWSYDETTGELTHGEVVYEEYFISSGFLVIGDRYRYKETIYMELYNLQDHTVSQFIPDATVPSVRSDIAFVSYSAYSADGDLRIFVTPEGKAVMDAFGNGQYTSYQFAEYKSKRVDLSKDFITDIENREPNLTLDVRTLRNATKYKILGIDTTGNFAHIMGAVYQTVDGHGYVYVDYDALENNMLDADGTLSYRGGEVPAYTLDAAMVGDLIVQAQNCRSVSPRVYSANDFEDDELDIDQTPALILFALMLSPILFIAPIIFLVLGIVLSLVKKIPGRKRWLGLVATSCLWLLCSIAITVLCIVAILL